MKRNLLLSLSFSVLAVALGCTAILHADEEANYKWAWNFVITAVDIEKGDLAGKNRDSAEVFQFKIDPSCKLTEKGEPTPLSRLKVDDLIAVGYVSGTDGTNLAKMIRYPFNPAADNTVTPPPTTTTTNSK